MINVTLKINLLPKISLLSGKIRFQIILQKYNNVLDHNFVSQRSISRLSALMNSSLNFNNKKLSIMINGT